MLKYPNWSLSCLWCSYWSVNVRHRKENYLYKQGFEWLSKIWCKKALWGLILSRKCYIRTCPFAIHFNLLNWVFKIWFVYLGKPGRVFEFELFIPSLERQSASGCWEARHLCWGHLPTHVSDSTSGTPFYLHWSTDGAWFCMWVQSQNSADSCG